jgi:hypothetical protein
VKSAYFMEKERRRRGMAECSSKEELSEIWKRLWALPIPRACLGLSLRNRTFKSKRAFGQKFHF